jgi:signal transduction histidine kinase
MRDGSIRFRLWSAATISILVALAIAGVGLRYLFERHVERRIQSELMVDLNLLIGATTFTTANRLDVTPILTDPRFKTPLSGYYWQVEDIANGTIVRSRSLWDTKLTLSPRNGDGTRRVQEIIGPEGSLLIAVDRTIVDANGRSFRAAVAEDHHTVEASVSEYVGELAPAIILLACFLIIAIFIQITVGLAPLENLRVAVSDVIARRAARLNVTAPIEVQPLAEEINRLLKVQEKALARARSRAADLAHGLKTPLQVLSADIRLLRRKGETELADEIEKIAATIRRHVEQELARARLAPGVSGKAECRVAEMARRVISVVKRTPNGERLTFVVNVDDNLTAPIDEGDLSEILGNLIENAARFAQSTIRVEASNTASGATIAIADDGTGIADADKESALSRGVRLDMNGVGTGLGLAIVSDITDAYGGRLTMTDAVPGLKVTIFLPQQTDRSAPLPKTNEKIDFYP